MAVSEIPPDKTLDLEKGNLITLCLLSRLNLAIIRIARESNGKHASKFLHASFYSSLNRPKKGSRAYS